MWDAYFSHLAFQYLSVSTLGESNYFMLLFPCSCEYTIHGSLTNRPFILSFSFLSLQFCHQICDSLFGHLQSLTYGHLAVLFHHPKSHDSALLFCCASWCSILRHDLVPKHLQQWCIIVNWFQWWWWWKYCAVHCDGFCSYLRELRPRVDCM